MKVIIDEKLFDRCQIALLHELGELIKSAVGVSDMSEETRGPFIETLLFAVTAVIDGSQVMEAEGRPLVPRIGDPFRDAFGQAIFASTHGNWSTSI